MSELLPSTERAYKDKIRELTEEKKMIYAAALRRVTAIINLNPDLSEEMKTDLLSQIWE
jgi:hypothetical protein